MDPMKKGGKVEEPRAIDLNVQLEGVAVPAAKELDLIIGESYCGSRGRGPATKAVPRELARIMPCGKKGGVNGFNKNLLREGTSADTEQRFVGPALVSSKNPA